MTVKSVDLLVMGGTGYAGKYVVKHLAKLTKEGYSDVTWAILGRSRRKIKDLVAEMNASGLDVSNIPVIECDIQKPDALKQAVQKGRVVVNCTGPNTVLSPPIVAACIKAGTHYVDISAEIFHILRLYRDYHKAAENADVLVVPSCGYDAIPVEVALTYLEANFEGTLHTVHCYNELQFPKKAYIPGVAGPLIHNGTWTSLVYVLEKFREHLALKQELFPQLETEPEEMKKSFFHRHNGQTWFPYPGTENDVVDISQKYLNERTQKKYIHFKAYTTVPLCIHFLIIPALYLYYYLSYFKCFRKLLIRYPRFFTLGYMSEKGPTEEMRAATKYSFVLNGKGWRVNEDLNSAPTKTLSVKVSGSDPGYDTTALAIIMSAITILKERDNMPKGGVILPGAAFHKTDIINRLKPHGFKYEILKTSVKNKTDVENDGHREKHT